MTAALAAWGRAGALTRIAREGGAAVAAPAQKGFKAKLEREVLEAAAKNNEVLSLQEKNKRIAAAMSAHMSLCAQKSAESRANKKIRQIAQPKAVCYLCKPSGKFETSTLCPTHRQQLASEIAALGH